MKKIKEFFEHPIIQLALVLAASTLTLKYFSKRICTEPLSNLELGLPAILAGLSQWPATRWPKTWWAGPWLGIIMVVLTTAVIVLLNLPAQG